MSMRCKGIETNEIKKIRIITNILNINLSMYLVIYSCRISADLYAKYVKSISHLACRSPPACLDFIYDSLNGISPFIFVAFSASKIV